MGNFLSTFNRSLSCYATLFKTIRRNLSGKKLESEVHVLNQFVSEGSICIDVGAAYGRYALQLSRLAGKSGHIYCFEPGDYSFNVLSKIKIFHRLKNITLTKKALSDKAGFAELSIPIKRKGKIGPSLAHLNVNNDSEGVIRQVIEMTTLNDFCTEQHISAIDFIKCDVEGAEFLFLLGAEAIIEKYQPTVLAEIDAEHLSSFDSSPDQIYNFFDQKGYQAFIFEDKLFKKVADLDQNHNYFFIHSDSEAIENLIKNKLYPNDSRPASI